MSCVTSRCLKQFGWFACVQTFFLELIVFNCTFLHLQEKQNLISVLVLITALAQTVAKATGLSLFCCVFFVKAMALTPTKLIEISSLAIKCSILADIHQHTM